MLISGLIAFSRPNLTGVVGGKVGNAVGFFGVTNRAVRGAYFSGEGVR